MTGVVRAGSAAGMTMITVRSLEHDRDWLRVAWSDGVHSTHPAIWLRDNIPAARHRAEGQKLFDVREVPAAVTIASAALDEHRRVAVRFAPEDVTARFDADWLLRYRQGAAAGDRPVLWDAALGDSLPAAEFTAVAAGGAALRDWLRPVVTHGFALLHGVPAEPGRIFDVVALFGHVRETNYGRLFDVITEAQPANLAYAGVGLGLHTDNPYRDPVPTLQLLHCLRASEHGGESLLVDGFQVAERLRAAAPGDFALLARHPVRFRYVDDGVDLQCVAPMIGLDSTGAVCAIRYNNRSLAPLELDPALLADYYRAYRRFSGMLHADDAGISFRLRPGDLVIMDNRRTLHGRRGFAGGRRHLQGCYADIDGLASRLRVLARSLP